jgi:hypothetical protein
MIVLLQYNSPLQGRCPQDRGVKKHAKLIVDMRNMIKESSEKVYKL